MAVRKAVAEAELRVIVTGSRHWPERELITAAFRDLGVTLVIHGDNGEADWIADAVAQSENITRIKFPPNWGKYHAAAGPKRNRFMFDTVRAAGLGPDLVLAFPMKDSIGTWDMCKYAESQGCAVIVEEAFLHKQADNKGKGKKR